MKKSVIKISILLLLIIVGTIQISFSQSRGLTNKLGNSIDLVVGGDLGFRLIDGDNSTLEVQEKINNREQHETYKLNYRFGLNYCNGITENLQIKIGLRFTNPGFSIGAINSINPEEDINTIEKVYKQQGNEYRYKYQFIEIPLGLKYVISGTFCNPYIELGFSTNIYRRTIVEEKYYEGGSRNQKINENIKKTNFISYVGFGGNFEIIESVSGFTQMIARYQLNNLRNDVIEERIISLGAEIGIRYNL